MLRTPLPVPESGADEFAAHAGEDAGREGIDDVVVVSDLRVEVDRVR